MSSILQVINSDSGSELTNQRFLRLSICEWIENSLLALSTGLFIDILFYLQLDKICASTRVGLQRS